MKGICSLKIQPDILLLLLLLAWNRGILAEPTGNMRLLTVSCDSVKWMRVHLEKAAHCKETQTIKYTASR